MVVILEKLALNAKSTDITTTEAEISPGGILPSPEGEVASSCRENENNVFSFSHLIANDKRLQIYNDTVPAGILILRIDDGTVLYTNNTFNEIFGVEECGLMGSAWERFFVDADDRQKLMVKFVEEEVVRGMELQLRRFDGSVVWGQVSLSDIPIDEEDLLLFSFVDITALKEAEEEIRRLANHDPLTKLPNLRLFKHLSSNVLSRSRRKKFESAIMFIDLDNFKNVNDTLGHEAGDMVLKEVAKRLLESVREADTVARIGGDEFVVILEDINLTNAKVVSQRIITELSKTICTVEGKTQIGASVGVSFFPQNGDSPAALIKAADKAMYCVKKNKKGSFAFA